MSAHLPKGDRRVPSNSMILKLLTVENLITVCIAIGSAAVIWTQLVQEVQATKEDLQEYKIRLEKLESSIHPLNSNLAVLNTKMDNVDENVKWLREQMARTTTSQRGR